MNVLIFYNYRHLRGTELRESSWPTLSSMTQWAGVAWWNGESVVLARISGALTGLGVHDLTNTLGDCTGFLQAQDISVLPGRISLAWSVTVVRGRRLSYRDESAGDDPDDELEV